MLPAPVFGDERDPPTGRLARRVQPEDLQGLQGVHRRRPRLPRFAAGVARREAGTTIPQPVGALERQEPGAPAPVFHACSFGGDLVGRGIREIAEHLPADGGVALEQPFDRVHRSAHCGTGQVRAARGTATVIVARLSWLSAPVRDAQASSERIHAGSPAGRSSSGIGARSFSVIVAP